MKKITVKDLGEVITGHTPPTSKREYYGDYYPFLKPTDMIIGSKYTYYTEEGYSELAYNKYKNSLIPKGATCVVCIGTLGEKMCMAHCDLFTNQSVNSIIPNEKFEEHYVFYLLKYNLHRVKALNKGTASGREFVSKTTFLDLEIDVHEDFQIQKKIGELLSTYDNLIENNQKQIKLLEEAAQRLYKEWFVDLRFPGHEDVVVVDGVPEGWQKEKLVDIADVIMGQSPKSEFYNNKKEGLPFHQGVGSYGRRFVVDEVYSTSYTRIADENSILFSVRAPVGRLNITKNRIVIGRGLAAIKHKSDYNSYLFYLLKERFFKDNIVGNGSIFASITKDELLSQMFLIPNENLVRNFNEITKNIDNKIKALDSQIDLLIQARDRLLPKLMSGEIEV